MDEIKEEGNSKKKKGFDFQCICIHVHTHIIRNDKLHNDGNL